MEAMYIRINIKAAQLWCMNKTMPYVHNGEAMLTEQTHKRYFEVLLTMSTPRVSTPSGSGRVHS